MATFGPPILDTEAKRCFATHDEDIDYFNMRIYYFNRKRIYSTVQLCSITSLWHSGQHLCRAIGRLQVRISLGFWLFSKRRSLWKKTYLAGLQCTLTSSCATTKANKTSSESLWNRNKRNF